MDLLVPDRNALPSIVALHQALCQRYGLEYKAENLVEDFQHNAYSLAIVLAPMVSPFATPTYGTYHGKNYQAEGAAHDHAWVNYLGTVIDPYRWLFTNSAPTIFEGESIGPDYVYEEGFTFRPLVRNVPARGINLAAALLVSFKWGPKVDIFLRDNVFQDSRDVSSLTLAEVTFLARLHYTQLFPFLHPIYAALIEKGYGHLIPAIYRKYYLHSQEEGN